MDLPSVWQPRSDDIAREERKREVSPASFFFSQGQALVLAAKYFNDGRLAQRSRGGVASKHRHRIHLALYGQLMAAFEFLLKDFVASVIDAVTLYDAALQKSSWVKMDVERVLIFRSAYPSPGALLIHPTQGWQDPDTVNSHYAALFNHEPINADAIPRLRQMWILRHSVAHNAGFVTAYDARRGGMPTLAERVAAIDDTFIAESFEFLLEPTRRLVKEVGGSILSYWFASIRKSGKDYNRDKETYSTLKLLATCVESRAEELPKILKGTYTSDFDSAARKPEKQASK